MDVAIYARISTRNTHQDLETQLFEIRAYCQERGLNIVAEFTDEGFSGSTDRRPGLDELMRGAFARKYKAVIVARFDRFARSARHLVIALEKFNHYKIDFISLHEMIDTSTPMGKMVFTVMAALAEFEKNIIRERVLSGMERARSQGKVFGRPPKIFRRDKVKEMAEQGISIRSIARDLKVDPKTVRKILNTPQPILDSEDITSDSH